MIYQFRFLCLLFGLLLASKVYAQDDNIQNQQSVFTIGMSYGPAVSLGDFSDRFGTHGVMGLDVEHISARQSIILGVASRYQFGNNVKEDVLAGIRGPENQVLGIDNTYGSVFLRQRGLFLGATIGKIFRLGSNSKSGLRISNATGIWMHWIRLQDDFDSVPQIDGQYRSGYDRFTSGLAMMQFLGFENLSLNRRINFNIGLELTEGFTRNRRWVDFSTMQSDHAARLDISLVLKATLFLPFYKGSYSGKGKEIFY